MILRRSLIEYPAVTTVALVYLEGDRDRRIIMERVHTHGCDRLELEKEGLMSFHESDSRKRRWWTRCQIICCGKSWGLDEPYGEKNKQTKICKHSAAQGQEATGNNVAVAFVDQGDTGERRAQAAAEHGIKLEVVKLPEAKKGFVLLPRRWVVERSFGGIARFRRLARDYERLPETLAGLHFLTFAILTLHRFVELIMQSSSHAPGGK